MSNKPLIRSNIALNAHQEGCKQAIVSQFEELKSHPPITNKKRNVLIIGGSSGYGLASRVALSALANAYTFNISFEREPRQNSSGSAGYYNNLAFQEIAQEKGIACDDLNIDAFSIDAKEQVIAHLKAKNITIDLVIYSVASGIRIDPKTGVKYTSSLKPIGDSFTGTHVDIAKETLSEQTLAPATDDEITETIKVMGGEDYLLWIEALTQAHVLSDGVTSITYTYLGSPVTFPIYKDGTIGQAKRDLESTNTKIQALLNPLHGKALISASKAVVTKASVFIPTMVLYVSALYKVMKEANTHESIVEHKARLFKDAVYGNTLPHDENGLIRLDHYEMDESIQKRVQEALNSLTPETYKNDVDFAAFKHEFLAINGFDVAGVDYN